MKHQHQKSPQCLNCGFTFESENNFCPRCGQENHDTRIPLRHLVVEFIEGFLHIDHKVFGTLRRLLFSPGHLTKEFAEGRRVAFLPPVRIYIFISFVFFFLANIVFVPHESEGDKTEHKVGWTLNLPDGELSWKDVHGISRSGVDSLIRARKIESAGFNKYMTYQMWRIENGPEGEFSHKLIKQFSYAMFIMMPLFAALLLLFFRREYYITTLIFSIHLHSFLFFCMSVLLALMHLPGMVFVFLAFFLLPPVYIYLALRKVFGESRIRTLLKTVGILLGYGVLVSMGVLAVIIISVLIF